jgi:hypothetical protein
LFELVTILLGDGDRGGKSFSRGNRDWALPEVLPLVPVNASGSGRVSPSKFCAPPTDIRQTAAQSMMIVIEVEN